MTQLAGLAAALNQAAASAAGQPISAAAMSVIISSRPLARYQCHCSLAAHWPPLAGPYPAPTIAAGWCVNLSTPAGSISSPRGPQSLTIGLCVEAHICQIEPKGRRWARSEFIGADGQAASWISIGPMETFPLPSQLPA